MNGKTEKYIVCSEKKDLLIFKIIESDSRDNAILKGGTGDLIVFAKKHCQLLNSFAHRNIQNRASEKFLFLEVVVIITITVNGVVKIHTTKSTMSDFNSTSEKDVWVDIALHQIFEEHRDDPVRIVYVGRDISNLEFHPYWYDSEDDYEIHTDNSVESWDTGIL